MVRSRWLVGPLVVVTALTVGACDGSPGPGDRPSAATTASSPTPSSVSPSPVDASPTAEDLVRVANARLSDSLGRLGGAVTVLEADTDLVAMMREVRGHAADGRQALGAVRKAAYPSSSRSCTAVASGIRSADSAASRGHTAARGLTTLTRRLTDERTTVRRARGAVSRDLEALETALDGRDPAGLDTVSVAEVRKALDAAGTSVITSAKESAALDARVRSDLRGLDGFADKAHAIGAKVC